LPLRVNAALRALDFAVQRVAIDVADDLPVDVDLVQVARSVIQVVELLSAR
jgi:hypothetical protein